MPMCFIHAPSLGAPNRTTVIQSSVLTWFQSTRPARGCDISRPYMLFVQVSSRARAGRDNSANHKANSHEFQSTRPARARDSLN